MIIRKTGNIFDSKCEILVNPVNCVGIMGAGLAKQFKTKYPEMFKQYEENCNLNLLKIGSYLYWNNKILNFVTKEHWRDNSNMSSISEGLKNFVESEYVKQGNIKSIAFPMLGCGLGGLRKHMVYELMIKILSKANIATIEIYV